MNTIAASNEKRGEVSASRIALTVKNGRFAGQSAAMRCLPSVCASQT